ncbi:hypothetical protein ACJJTC_002462 [Scirpophaga incertulas]
MDSDLQHEDILIKIRAKLVEHKIKLWEPPYALEDNELSQSLQDLAQQYAAELSLDTDTVLKALRELQIHSMDRFKANKDFKESGCATVRVKATKTGKKPQIIKVQKKLDVPSSELIQAVADEVQATSNRIKLIYNGTVLKPEETLEKQGVKNGVQIMAVIMTESPEQVEKEDRRYLEMKTTRDDALLLSETVNDLTEGDDYMMLEDQTGKAVKLPAKERRALLVGLTLHERGRAAARRQDWPLALVLLLEADRLFRECSSKILKSVDNWAVLQLDIAWAYLCVRDIACANDAATRLEMAEEVFKKMYGENHERLVELKGSRAANERVLFMRLYLLQGIVCFHQNRRTEAKALLNKAEKELNFLRVDESSVSTLMEVGWSEAEARAGLRAVGASQGGTNHVDAAHAHLEAIRDAKKQARIEREKDRKRRNRGLCVDGSAVNPALVEALQSMGYSRKLATRALQQSNNHVGEAVRLIQEEMPDALMESESSSDEQTTAKVEPEPKFVEELLGMGYKEEHAKLALRMSNNEIAKAVELLLAAGSDFATESGSANPSTSTEGNAKKKLKKVKKDKEKQQEREQALKRLSSVIKTGEDDYLDSSLREEEEFLVQYKSLL